MNFSKAEMIIMREWARTVIGNHNDCQCPELLEKIEKELGCVFCQSKENKAKRIFYCERECPHLKGVD